MTIELNGERRELPEGTNVVAVVELTGAGTAGRDGRGLAVAIDGEVVPRARWAATTLGEGQRVEVLQAVGGGS